MNWEELTEIHDVVSADGAIVDNNIPGPQSNGIPLDVFRFNGLAKICLSKLTFLTSNLFFSSEPDSATAPLDDLALDLLGTTGPDGASVISTSAMLECSGLKLNLGMNLEDESSECRIIRLS